MARWQRSLIQTRRAITVNQMKRPRLMYIWKLVIQFVEEHTPTFDI